MRGRNQGPLIPKLKYYIADGVVGDILARYEVLARYRQGEHYKQESFNLSQYNSLPMTDQHKVILAWLTVADHDAALMHNPIYQELQRSGLPFRPEVKLTSLKNGMLECGCCLYYWDKNKDGYFSKEVAHRASVRMPNFNVDGCHGCGSHYLAKTITLYVALEEAKQLCISPRDIPQLVLLSAVYAVGEHQHVRMDMIVNRPDDELVGKTIDYNAGAGK